MPTTVSSTIGTTGDYTTIQAWEDASPANLVTDDKIWEGKCQNQTFSSTGTVVTLGGSTTDSTRYKHLTTATGASFRDNANVQTNALRYNTSNGAAITTTGDYARAITISESNVHLTGLQVAGAGGGSYCRGVGYTSGGSTVIDFCIIEGKSTNSSQGAAVDLHSCTIRNSLLVSRSNSTNAYIVKLASTCYFYNVTMARASDLTSGGGISADYCTLTFKNVAMFGCPTAFKVSTISSATYTTCYTDAPSPPTGWSSLTYDTSTGSGFQNITDSTRDFRVKSGSGLLDVGTTDTTNGPIDIAGTSRPQGSAYDVGCWELVSGAAATSNAMRRAGARFAHMMGR